MKPKLLSAGELLWDVMPDGRRCGGAPGNLTAHASRQDLDAMLCSALGYDEDGDALGDEIAAIGLCRDFIERNNEPTGTVTVDLSGATPQYIIHAPAAWDKIRGSQPVRRFAGNAAAFCFGSLAQRDPVSRETILELAALTGENALRVFDVNLRQNFYSGEILQRSLTIANVLKLSSEELPVLQKMFVPDAADPLTALLEKFQLRFLLFTLGADGSIYLDGKERLEQPCVSCGKVVDTVGCGDSFLASFLATRLQGGTPREAMRNAAETAGKVASVKGALLPDR